MRFLLLSLALSGAMASTAAVANDTEIGQAVLSTNRFLSYHPDQLWRGRALESYKAGDYEKAFKQFRRSARFAEKGSQAMVAEMLWSGQGTTADRAAAYAWMDLAAERGYADFLRRREAYWSELSESDRQRAIEIGKEVYAEYGDDVAKPRLASKIRQGRLAATGSRTGGSANVRSYQRIGDGDDYVVFDGSQFYSEQFWQPEAYFAWQDKVWKNINRGQVTVGELMQAAPVPEPTDPDA